VLATPAPAAGDAGAIVRCPSGESARLTLARSVEAVRELRPRFERAQPQQIDAELDYFLTVVEHRGAVLQPHVLALDLADGREITVVARLERQPGAIARGARPLRRLQVSFGGIVGADSRADCELALAAIRGVLSGGEADFAVLPMIQEGSQLYELARAGASWWRRDHVPSRSVHWLAEIPDSLDRYIAARGKSTRRNLKRRPRRILDTYGDAVEVRAYTEPEQLEELAACLESITAKSYQRGLHVGYTGDQMQRALMDLAARRGWLRAQVLHIAGTPVAFILGYCYRGTLYGHSTSFDPAYGQLRVGEYVQLKMAEALCLEPGVHTWDFGSGEAEYKQAFGDRRLREAEVLLFGPSLAAIGYNAVRSARVAASSAAKAWVANSRLGARLKGARRERALRRARSLAAE